MKIEKIKLKDLEPCPFCGADPLIITTRVPLCEDRRYYVACMNCGIEQSYSDDYENAVNKWNERIK